MYLVISGPHDKLAHQVTHDLQAQGLQVLHTGDPLGVDTLFSWQFDTWSSRWQLEPVPATRRTPWQGVFLRQYTGPNLHDWPDEERTYQHTESMAAAVAWLAHLSCTVVGRPNDDLWYRPYRTLPEWNVLFQKVNLPSSSLVIVSTPQDVLKYRDVWQGRAIYAPLTGESTYPLTTDESWQEVLNIAAYLPLCLLEPQAQPAGSLVFLAGKLAWCGPVPSNASLVELGVQALARLLNTDSLQVQYALQDQKAKCIRARLQPDLHDLDSAQLQQFSTAVLAALNVQQIVKQSSQMEQEVNA